MEIFWQTIAHYNSWSWIYQLIIVGIGILLSVLLFYRPRTWVKNSMKCYLAGVYLWLSIAYYYFDCGIRAYNGVMALIWALLALVWIWDLKTGYTTFNRTHKYDKLAYLLLAMPFVYPVISLLRGLTFPMITSPVMPCSVVVFTLGIMLLFSEKINLFLILCLTHWSVIENVLLQYSGRFLVVKCICTGTLLFLQRILCQLYPSGNKTLATNSQELINPFL